LQLPLAALHINRRCDLENPSNDAKGEDE
jgi:hypothetical protein